MVEELLAQVVEEVSVLTAKKYSREKPRTIDRPKWVGGGDQAAPERNQNPYSRAIDRLFSFTPPTRGGR